jgi:DNA-binding response OmpR family regulator
MLAEQLASGIFRPVEVATLREAARHLDLPDARFDAIILDINLPDGNGRDFCAHLRKTGHSMPIIMLTGAAAEADIVSGLEAGASDYIAKPVRCRELIARLNAQLRMYDASEHAVFTIGPYTFRPAVKLLCSADNRHRVVLTSKEVNILKFLYRHGDKDIPRQRLLDEVWGYNSEVTTHTLETHIYRLRQKLGDLGSARLLATVPGGGYRLNLSPVMV